MVQSVLYIESYSTVLYSKVQQHSATGGFVRIKDNSNGLVCSVIKRRRKLGCWICLYLNQLFFSSTVFKLDWPGYFRPSTRYLQNFALVLKLSLDKYINIHLKENYFLSITYLSWSHVYKFIGPPLFSRLSGTVFSIVQFTVYSLQCRVGCSIPNTYMEFG